ncbi:hypothetical protein ACWDA7_48095 [Streptomyces sp. NPDC001156]
MLTAVLGVVALMEAQTMPGREKPSGQHEATVPATTTTWPGTRTLPTKPAQEPVSDLSGTVNTADTLKMTTATPTSSGTPTTPAGLTSGESTQGKKVSSSTDPSPTFSPTTTEGGGTISIGLIGGLLGG